MPDIKDFGLWTRRLIAMMVIGCYVYLSVIGVDNPGVKELSLLVLGFYFGQAKEST